MINGGMKNSHIGVLRVEALRLSGTLLKWTGPTWLSFGSERSV